MMSIEVYVGALWCHMHTGLCPVRTSKCACGIMMSLQGHQIMSIQVYVGVLCALGGGGSTRIQIPLCGIFLLLTQEKGRNK